MTKHYEQRKEANKRYLEKQDEIKVRLPKGRKADIEAYATANGYSVNGLVTELLQNVLGMPDEEWKAAEKAGE